MPLGIAVDNQAGKVWYLSTKQGVLGNYNLITKKFDKEISNPVWNVRKYPMDFSNVWSVKVDPKGNSIWFTDEKQNTIWRYSKALGFDMYKIPEKSPAFGTISPVSLDFDSKGDLYFVGMHSPVLWFGNFTQMKNNTSDGIRKIRKLHQGNDGWWMFYHNFAGESRMKYSSDPKFGILGHTFIGGGLEWHVFVRIIPNEDGSTVTWIVKPDGLGDDRFHKQLVNFDSEISNWKSTLEGKEK